MTKPRLPKIQHYVPQFILKNFCIGNSEQVFVFDKLSGTIFKANVKNVAAEKGFYNIEYKGIIATIEHNLSRMETDAKEIIQKIISDENLKSLTDKKKHILSYFIAAQFSRVKQSRIMMEQLERILFEKLNELGSTPQLLSDYIPRDSTVIKNESVASLREKILLFAPHFYEKIWMLFKTPELENFYISDNPVTLQNMIDYGLRGNIGLAVKGIEIYFPLSSKLTLGMLCPSYEQGIRKNYRRLKILKIIGLLKRYGFEQHQLIELKNLKRALENSDVVTTVKESVINLNSLQVYYSSRFVYSCSNNFILAREMIEKNPKLKYPPMIGHN